MGGKALGPLKCKICDGEHQGTLCTRYTTIKVVPVPQPKRLALPAPGMAARKKPKKNPRKKATT